MRFSENHMENRTENRMANAGGDRWAGSALRRIVPNS